VLTVGIPDNMTSPSVAVFTAAAAACSVFLWSGGRAPPTTRRRLRRLRCPSMDGSLLSLLISVLVEALRCVGGMAEPDMACKAATDSPAVVVVFARGLIAALVLVTAFVLGEYPSFAVVREGAVDEATLDLEASKVPSPPVGLHVSVAGEEFTGVADTGDAAAVRRVALRCAVVWFRSTCSVKIPSSLLLALLLLGIALLVFMCVCFAPELFFRERSESRQQKQQQRQRKKERYITRLDKFAAAGRAVEERPKRTERPKEHNSKYI
jgi:hypothetical protein